MSVWSSTSHALCHQLISTAMTIINDSNTASPNPPHVVLVPVLAQGHTIPMLDMARLLAERGVLVSFITTPVNASRIKPIIDRVHESNLPINFIELPFPFNEAGLPLGCENFDLVPSRALYRNFFDAIRLLAHPLEERLRELVPRPTCMINDMWNPWTADVASSLNIRRLVFHGPSCVYVYCNYVFLLRKMFDNVTDKFEEITMPGLTDDLGQSFKIPKVYAFGFLNSPGYEKLRDEVLHAEETTDGVVMHTFDDIEPVFVEAYKKLVGKDVWTVGPLCLYDKDDANARIARGNKAAVDQEKLFTWLDSMQEKSVLYVSFGSLQRMKVEQILEIGPGLEASDVPFIWVIKDGEKCPEVDEWLEGFEKRAMSTRSFVIKGWAPQAAILSHKSVGGFLSHCGWNSTLEAVSNGVPMITWPQVADQFLNERLVVESLRIGIAIGVKKPVLFYGEDEIPVRSYDVERAVRSLMSNGKEAEERRIKAREIKEKAIKAMAEGGSSYENITRLVEYIKQKPCTGVQGVN